MILDAKKFNAVNDRVKSKVYAPLIAGAAFFFVFNCFYFSFFILCIGFVIGLIGCIYSLWALKCQLIKTIIIIIIIIISLLMLKCLSQRLCIEKLGTTYGVQEQGIKFLPSRMQCIHISKYLCRVPLWLFMVLNKGTVIV